eukprot:3454445-Amphidinium_carterae.1
MFGEGSWGHAVTSICLHLQVGDDCMRLLALLLKKSEEIEKEILEAVRDDCHGSEHAQHHRIAAYVTHVNQNDLFMEA